MVRLVKAEEIHISELVKISKAAFESDVFVGAADGDFPPDYDSTQWHCEMMELGHLFVAICENKIVGGAIVFWQNKEKSVYVGRIFVSPSEFKKGYGIAIMNKIEAMYPQALIFNLDTPEWNLRTNKFYRKLGYKVQKTSDGFVYYQKTR